MAEQDTIKDKDQEQNEAAMDEQQENVAHVITHDPRDGDDRNAISGEEIEETISAAKKGTSTAYYKTLAQQNAEQDGETDDMDQPVDEGFAGFSDPQLAELSTWGRFKRRYYGVIDRGDYFSLIADKQGQITDEALRQTILSLVLVKGYNELYFYRQGKIDPTLSTKANIILNQLQQPGHALEGRTDVRVENTYRMRGLEPWKAQIAEFGLPFMPSKVNAAVNYLPNLLFGGMRAAVLEPFDQRSKRKERRTLEKASIKSTQNERKVAKEYIDKKSGQRLDIEAQPTKWQLLRQPRLAVQTIMSRIMAKTPSGRKAIREQESMQKRQQIDMNDQAWRQKHRPEEVARESVKTTNAQNKIRGMQEESVIAGRDDLSPTDIDGSKTSQTEGKQGGSADTHGEETGSSGGGGRRPEPSEDFGKSAQSMQEKTEARADKEVKTGKTTGEPDPVKDGLTEVASGNFEGEHVSLEDATEQPDVPVEQLDRDNNTTPIPGRTPGS